MRGKECPRHVGIAISLKKITKGEGQSRLEPRERLRSAHVFLEEKMVIHRNTQLPYVDYIKTFLLQKLSSMSD